MKYEKPQKVVQKKVASSKAAGGSRIMLTEDHPLKSLPECGHKPKSNGKMIVEKTGK